MNVYYLFASYLGTLIKHEFVLLDYTNIELHVHLQFKYIAMNIFFYFVGVFNEIRHPPSRNGFV